MNCGILSGSALTAKTKSIIRERNKKKIEIINCDLNTVKPILSSHSKIDKTKVFMANGSLMKVNSIAECSEHSAILLTCIKR